jgi:hypothetical protein
MVCVIVADLMIEEELHADADLLARRRPRHRGASRVALRLVGGKVVSERLPWRRVRRQERRRPRSRAEEVAAR